MKFMDLSNDANNFSSWKLRARARQKQAETKDSKHAAHDYLAQYRQCENTKDQLCALCVRLSVSLIAIDVATNAIVHCNISNFMNLCQKWMQPMMRRLRRSHTHKRPLSTTITQANGQNLRKITKQFHSTAQLLHGTKESNAPYQ